jgi:hypothetical protein
VDYLEAVALSLHKPGEEAASSDGNDTVTVLPGGEKPSAAQVHTKQVTAKVDSVDAAAGTVTLRGPEGRTVTVNADSEQIQRVKPGDEVTAQYTEALAVDVRTP